MPNGTSVRGFILYTHNGEGRKIVSFTSSLLICTYGIYLHDNFYLRVSSWIIIIHFHATRDSSKFQRNKFICGGLVVVIRKARK